MRSRMFILGLILGLSWLLTAAYTPAQAHMDDKSYFSVNGEHTRVYPVEYTTAEPNALSLPHDLAPGTYVVGQSVTLAVDLHELEHEYPDIVADTGFEWDLGDGTQATGASITHTYSRRGSYIINVYATSHMVGDKRHFLESVIINIVPSASYHISRPMILINGEEVTIAPNSEGAKQEIAVNMNEPVDLEVRMDGAPTLHKIVWDLGDRTTSAAQHVTHTYGASHDVAFIIAHVEDSDGFITDATGVIRHVPTIIKKPSYMDAVNIIIGIVGASIGVVGVLALRHHRRTRRS